MARLFLAPLGLGLLVALGGCHHDPKPMHVKAGDLPPLPPASGTPIGYLLDDSTDLKLNEDQVTKLKDLDASLAAQNSEIDTQLRQIEKPRRRRRAGAGQGPSAPQAAQQRSRCPGQVERRRRQAPRAAQLERARGIEAGVRAARSAAARRRAPPARRSRLRGAGLGEEAAAVERRRHAAARRRAVALERSVHRQRDAAVVVVGDERRR